MTKELLEYPQRHYGMDHDRYEWSMLQDRKPVTWPGGKPLALWIIEQIVSHAGSSAPPPICS